METIIVFLLCGYIVGSISPGYFFGKLIKKIDIRNYGKVNTGATNTYHVVGPVYGIVTGIIDFIKAPLVFYIADSFSGIGIGTDLAILIGLAAVFGHIFPFYLGFRGGRGVASLYGLNAIILVPFNNFSFYSLTLFIGTVFYSIVISQRPEIKEALGEAPARKFLKLGGLIFPLGLLIISQSTMAWIAGAGFSTMFSFDILRFMSPRLNERYLRLKSLAKHKELKRFSGYTLFFFSIFIIFAFFDKNIAILSTIAFIVGDIFAPFGNVFSSKKLVGEKTWGGAGLVFLMAVVSGFFFKNLVLLALPAKIIVGSAFSATILDQMAFKIDDNILVPIGTAVILTLLWIH